MPGLGNIFPWNSMACVAAPSAYAAAAGKSILPSARKFRIGVFGILNLHARLYLAQIRLLNFCAFLIMLLSHNRGLSREGLVTRALFEAIVPIHVSVLQRLGKG